MRVVIAPDSFKSTLTAAQAAEAIADGWAEARPDDDLILRPMADGGEGTLDAFAGLPGAERVPVDVVNALGEPRSGSWVRLADGTAVVELAECCGLLTIDHRAPREAHTVGFGMAIRAAIEAGSERLLLAIGGSASTDGGSGLLAALGVQLLSAGLPYRRCERLGNVALAEVDAVDWANVIAPPPRGAAILSDVTNPLLGPDGAAAVFGPQKGGASIVAELEENLRRWADVLGGDSATPGSGAAGGAGFALQRWGATTTSGARAVADAIGLPGAIADADLVVTGEGSYDAQSSGGKTVSVVQELAAGVPVALIAGRVVSRFPGPLISLWDLAGPRAMTDAYGVVRDAARTLASRC